MLGTKPGLAAGMTSVSPNAVEMCRQVAISAIPGGCPNQYLKPDFGHAQMRVMWCTLGFYSVN